MSNVSLYARGGPGPALRWQQLATEPGCSLVTRLPGSPCATEKPNIRQLLQNVSWKRQFRLGGPPGSLLKLKPHIHPRLGPEDSEELRAGPARPRLPGDSSEDGA